MLLLHLCNLSFQNLGHSLTLTLTLVQCVFPCSSCGIDEILKKIDLRMKFCWNFSIKRNIHIYNLLFFLQNFYSKTNFLHWVVESMICFLSTVNVKIDYFLSDEKIEQKTGSHGQFK